VRSVSRRIVVVVAVTAAVIVAGATYVRSSNDSVGGSVRSDVRALRMLVMDPLAGPLACDCVEGYAQRQYEKLAEFLIEKLGRAVEVVYAESLQELQQRGAGGAIDLIIGKDSTVRFRGPAGKAVRTGNRPADRQTGQHAGMGTVRGAP